MTMHNEPVLGADLDRPRAAGDIDPAVPERIRRLVTGEPFGVLCTQGGGQPYGSVVGFAFDKALTAFAFATPRATRKYDLLSQCDRVALVVDNRGSFPDDLMKVGAVTVTGRAREVDPGPEFDHWAGLLRARHPYFRSFVEAPSTALFCVDVVRYIHVTRFQEVHQWIPPSTG
jgi:uncharacterized protein YhbP (UPF0306 family)